MGGETVKSVRLETCFCNSCNGLCFSLTFFFFFFFQTKQGRTVIHLQFKMWPVRYVLSLFQILVISSSPLYNHTD